MGYLPNAFKDYLLLDERVYIWLFLPVKLISVPIL